MSSNPQAGDPQPQSSYWDGLLRDRGKLGRLVLAVLMAAGAAVGGYFLGSSLLDAVPEGSNLRWAAAALGFSALLGMFKEGMGLLPAVLGYLKSGQGQGLYKFCVFVAVSVATATISWRTAVPPSKENGAVEPPRLEVETSQVLFLSRRSETSFVVPFFEEADLCGETICKGAKLDPSTIEFLNRFVDGLVDCGSPGEPVELQVRGYASSSKFDKRTDSDDLNLRTANLRADSVVDAILERLEASEKPDDATASLSVRTVRWSTYESMKTATGFKDVNAENDYSPLRGLLNRRAEVLLVDPADCRVAG